MNEKMYKASDVIGILLEEITNAEFLRVAERLSDIPSAVVRCKDCRFHENEQIGMVYCPAVVGGWVEDNWFCKGGDRRSE